MTQIWPKRAIFEFSQKMRKRQFFPLQRLGLVKKLANYNKQIAKKCEKNLTFGHFGPKWTMLEVFGQNGQNGDFFQKSAWNIFVALTSPN